MERIMCGVNDNIDISIVIPCKNGEKKIKENLTAIFSQKTQYAFEVIIVDSGSNDNTLRIVRDFPVRLYQIPPTEFGHGRTRAWAGQQALGRYVVYITQDAVPASESWLEKLVEPFLLDESIMGVFGIHYPYPDCNPFDTRDLKRHFQNFGQDVLIQCLDEPERYGEDVAYRQWLGFFSDNNACVRKTAFDRYPYPDVNFAEDQVWAKMILEAGYKKAYTPYAPVYHSHNYQPYEYFDRAFDEFQALYHIYQYRPFVSFHSLCRFICAVFWTDVRYLRSLPMRRSEKLRWAKFSFLKNIYRFWGAYRGGEAACRRYR
ncbi:MAG TPA: glycosyltransferase [Patescibacteria group bacterium]|nr:glycosyltransferase [Patescibacteria group bacterium]